MSISATGGVTGNTTSNVTSFALPQCSPTTGQDMLVAVSLSSTGSSVSSITNGGPGTYAAPILQVAVNGTGIRLELWSIHVTTGGSNVVFTINITGGACQVSASLFEWAGVSSYGSTSSQTGNSNWMQGSQPTTQGNNWIVTCFGFACVAADTWSSSIGTNREATLPNATAVANAINDNSSAAEATLVNAVAITTATARQWATVSIELKSGSSAILPTDYGDLCTAWSSVPTYLVGQTVSVVVGGVTIVYRCILSNTNHAPPNATYWAQQDVFSGQPLGTSGYRILQVLEPLFCQQQLFTSSTLSQATNSGFMG